MTLFKFKYKMNSPISFDTKRTSCIVLVVAILLIQISCKKIVDIEAPVTSTNAGNVYSQNETAAAVLTGLYTTLSSKSNDKSGGLTNLSYYTALSADELSLVTAITGNMEISYYRNALLSTSPGAGYEYWNIIYPYLFTCNSAIEGLTTSTTLSPSVKQQLLGEAKFMRAFLYFYLANLYGDVPLVLTTDYTINVSLSRTPIAQVYQHIITDLKDAQNFLDNNFLKSDLTAATIERVRPTKWAATSLLSRVYLYTGDWVNAEAEATKVINNSSLFNLSNLNTTFLKNSSESIWQLQPVNSGQYANTADAVFFIIPSTGLSSNNPVYLSNSLINSFEPGDQRKINWVGKYTDMTSTPNVDYYYSYKYKVNTNGASVSEYLTVLRLAEQYLIRAEARAQQSNISGAQNDLNVIRTRAGLSNTAANDKGSLVNAIFKERRVELFTEWGNRWLDLKRSNTVNSVMSIATPLKGGIWSSNWQLYPLPSWDLLLNQNLVQNQGY